MTNIEKAIAEIKGYAWASIPFLPALECYVKIGDPAILKQVTVCSQQSGCMAFQMALALRLPDQWQDEDRRVVHVLAATGEEQSVWMWLNGRLDGEKDGQDWRGIIARELEMGRKQGQRLAADTLKRIYALKAGEKPNSAGRYLLSLSEDAIRQAIKTINNDGYGAELGSFTDFLLTIKPGCVPALVDDLLICERGRSVALAVVESLLKRDRERYGPVVAQWISKTTGKHAGFLAARELYDVDPNRYGELARGTI